MMFSAEYVQVCVSRGCFRPQIYMFSWVLPGVGLTCCPKKFQIEKLFNNFNFPLSKLTHLKIAFIFMCAQSQSGRTSCLSSLMVYLRLLVGHSFQYNFMEVCPCRAFSFLFFPPVDFWNLIFLLCYLKATRTRKDFGLRELRPWKV